MIQISRTDSNNVHFRELVQFLDKELKAKDGDDHAFFAQFNKIDHLKHVVLACKNEVPVGCGAVKAYTAEVGEVKRMYVHSEFRGKGIATQVLKELEKWAQELKFSRLILETAKANVEANRLYLKNAYSVIPNYGQYEGVESSVCMQKVL